MEAVVTPQSGVTSGVLPVEKLHTGYKPWIQVWSLRSKLQKQIRRICDHLPWGRGGRNATKRHYFWSFAYGKTPHPNTNKQLGAFSATLETGLCGVGSNCIVV
jgi:hypothetical protein